jgi:hypothetical protein
MWEIALRLLLAVILGGSVGFERESHNRPAGFRTHILVCTGSALIMMVSAYGFSGLLGPGSVSDPGQELINIELLVEIPLDIDLKMLFNRLYCLTGVKEVYWEGDLVRRDDCAIDY